MYKKLTHFILFMLVLSAIPAFAQSGDVDVDIPDIPPGQQVTITYRARVNDSISNVPAIIDQGHIIIGNETLLTDDPRVTGNTDPTRTLVSPKAITLPNTGEIPWWRDVAVIGAIALVLASLATFVISKRYAPSRG